MRTNKLIVFLVLTVFVAGLVFTLPVAPSSAQVPAVTIDAAGFGKASVPPGASQQASFSWSKTGEGDPVVIARVLDPTGAVYYQEEVLLQGESGDKTVGFTVGDCAAAGTYRLSIRYGGIEILTGISAGFEVEAVEVGIRNVTVATAAGGNPPVVKPGGQVTVNFEYTASAATTVDVAVGNLVTAPVPVLKTTPWTPHAVALVIPQGAADGKYPVTVKRCGETLHSAANAVEVKRDPVVSATITSPTQSEPDEVRVGATVRVHFRYTNAGSQTVTLDVSVMSGNTLRTGRSVQVTGPAANTARHVDLPLPTSIGPGKYDVVLSLAGQELNRQQEALRVLEKASVEITSPTRSKPVSVSPGDKVTVQFSYTADPAATADVKLVGADGKSLIMVSTSLDRTATKRAKSLTFTVPAAAAHGKYDVVVAGRTSGGTLAVQKEAVMIETKVAADITSPTAAKPVVAAPGDRVGMTLEYTAAAATDIELRMVRPDGSNLATWTVPLVRATTKRTQTVSFTVPSSAAQGKYDLVVASKVSGAAFDTEKGAVVVENKVAAQITAPTRSAPVSVRPGDRVNVQFEYTAEAAADVDVLLKGPDGKTLVTRTVSLARATAKRSETAALTVPAAAAQAKYDVVVAGRHSGTALATQREAVQVFSYPVNVVVRFAIGESGRWVGNTWQATDCAPVLLDNRTLLAVRHVGEPLGWEFDWDEERKMTTVKKGDLWVRVWVNESGARISRDGGKTWVVAAIDPNNQAVKPVIMNGRTMLPLRFVAEALETQVDWNANTRTVTVTQYI